jgi:hypothetical protein
MIFFFLCSRKLIFGTKDAFDDMAVKEESILPVSQVHKGYVVRSNID